VNTLSYIGSIVLVNWAFSVVPVIKLPWGQMFTPLTFVVGFTFILRDYAQREIGSKKVLGAMVVGVGLSYFMASPFVATASATAFALSELVDWGCFTFTKKPFADRILISSAVGTPVDSVVFLVMIGQFSIVSAVVMTLSKMVGAVLVWRAIK